MGTTVKTIRDYSPNYIINGAMDFWQRGNATYTLINASSNYARTDRWMFRYGGSGGGSLDRATTVPPSPAPIFKYSLKFTQTSALVTSLQALQKIEADIMKPLVGQVMTISCWVMFAATTDNYSITAITPTSSSDDTWTTVPISNDVTVASTLIPSSSFTAGVWTQVSCTFTVPASASKGLAVSLTNNGSTTNGLIYYMTGAQLTLGAGVPPVFQRAGTTMFGELSLCQRYYEKSYDIDVAPGTATNTGEIICVAAATGTTAAITSMLFKVQKRISGPTVIGYSNSTGASNNLFNNNLAADFAVVSTGPFHNGVIFRSNGTSITAGQQIQGHYTADAEL